MFLTAIILTILLEGSMLAIRWKYARHYEKKFRWFLTGDQRQEAFSYAWAHGYEVWVMAFFFIYGIAVTLSAVACFK